MSTIKKSRFNYHFPEEGGQKSRQRPLDKDLVLRTFIQDMRYSCFNFSSVWGDLKPEFLFMYFTLQILNQPLELNPNSRMSQRKVVSTKLQPFFAHFFFISSPLLQQLVQNCFRPRGKTSDNTDGTLTHSLLIPQPNPLLPGSAGPAHCFRCKKPAAHSLGTHRAVPCFRTCLTYLGLRRVLVYAHCLNCFSLNCFLDMVKAQQSLHSKQEPGCARGEWGSLFCSFHSLASS